MSELWTRDRVLALAPDAASASAGEALAHARQWKLLGCTDEALWGEVQGSGSKPYQTRIDLSEPAFKCSCPSRKFPCKHALGLFLIHAGDRKALKPAEPPGWVREWIEDRQQRAARKAEKREDQDAGTPPRDEKAAQRRALARQEKIASGLDELTLWMEDVVRQGLAAAQAQPTSFWEHMAARLVDAQAPGLARRVRDLSSAAYSGEGWQQRLLAGLGRLSLLVAAYRRLDALPVELAEDVRGEVGWSRSAEEALAQPGVADAWVVLGNRIVQEDQLKVQRAWLWGLQSHRRALILHFAAGSAPLDASLAVGTRLQAELAFFPSASPLRALIKSNVGPGDASPGRPAGRSIAEELTTYAHVLAHHPWMERWPMLLADVTVEAEFADGRLLCCRVHDRDAQTIALHADEAASWQLFAIGGGRRVTLFGEWDGERLWPLSAAVDERFFALMALPGGLSLVRVA